MLRGVIRQLSKHSFIRAIGNDRLGFSFRDKSLSVSLACLLTLILVVTGIGYFNLYSALRVTGQYEQNIQSDSPLRWGQGPTISIKSGQKEFAHKAPFHGAAGAQEVFRFAASIWASASLENAKAAEPVKIPFQLFPRPPPAQA